MKDTVSNWKDKEFRKKYVQKWRAKRKIAMGVETGALPTDVAMTPWKKRRLQKQASQVRPLKLCGCPECGVEFGIRKDGQYQDIKLDNCPICERRFYQAGGPV